MRPHLEQRQFLIRPQVKNVLTDPSGITTFQEYCRRLLSIRVASE